MNKIEHLYSQLNQEGLEVCHEIDKILHFGADTIEPGQRLTNRQRLLNEIDDFMGALERLNDEGLGYEIDQKAVAAKKEKIDKFMKLAKKNGALRD